jgi:hypothetical protein
MRSILAFASLSVMAALSVMASSVLAQQSSETQSVAVGPWTIATTYKSDKFEDCTMTRSIDKLTAVFVRNKEGVLLKLDSADWRLDRGKAYPVRLSAGSQVIEANAMAESKSVTITLADKAFNERLRLANGLEVRGEGATLVVPLDGSAAALERLDTCFDKNARQSPDSNPFVAPTRKP